MLRNFCRGRWSHYKEVDKVAHRFEKGDSWKPPHKNQWEQGSPRLHETTKARPTEAADKHNSKEQSAISAILDANRQLVDALSDDGEHKDAILALQKVVAKKREREPVQVQQDKVKSLGDKWEYMDKRRKDEMNTVLKLKEQLKVHEDSLKERKTKMAPVKRELDATVADLNEARQREQEDEGDPEGETLKQGGAGATQGAQMAQPVPGPMPKESRKGATGSGAQASHNGSGAQSSPRETMLKFLASHPAPHAK